MIKKIETTVVKRKKVAKPKPIDEDKFKEFKDAVTRQVHDSSDMGLRILFRIVQGASEMKRRKAVNDELTERMQANIEAEMFNAVLGTGPSPFLKTEKA